MAETWKDFDFGGIDESIDWDVDELIKSETMSSFVSKAGVGKSFLAEYLAVCFVYGHKFLRRKIEPHNVLLIDQDTPTDTLERRLRAFGRYMRKIGEKKR